MSFRLEPSRDRRLFRLVKKAQPLRLSKGSRVYDAGAEADALYVVREGYVRLVLPGMEKGRGGRTVGIALPWELFGFESLIGGHRRYSTVAGTPSVVHALPGSEVMAALKSARKTLDAYLTGTERELHRLRHARAGSRGPTVRQRLAEVLLDLAERGGDPVGRGRALPVRLTHQVLADLAGAHRATVTTLLNEWFYDGILKEGPGSLVLAKPAALWALAGYSTLTPP